MQAAAQGAFQVVSGLLNAGADPNKVTTNGLTALMLASSKSNMDVIDILINFKADVNMLNKVTDRSGFCSCFVRGFKIVALLFSPCREPLDIARFRI